MKFFILVTLAACANAAAIDPTADSFISNMPEALQAAFMKPVVITPENLPVLQQAVALSTSASGNLDVPSFISRLPEDMQSAFMQPIEITPENHQEVYQAVSAINSLPTTRQLTFPKFPTFQSFLAAFPSMTLQQVPAKNPTDQNYVYDAYTLPSLLNVNTAMNLG